MLLKGIPEAEGSSRPAGAAEMAKEEITIRILLGRGQYTTKVYTIDFSYDYVKINADYRS